jgi:ABC-type bacteriocin/lantibiotic exporter with double-glycine peptidase domain
VTLMGCIADRVFACSLAIAMWVVSAGCASIWPHHFSAETDDALPNLYIPRVPFYPQETYQCGPSSLAAVLGYWGISASPEQISTAIYQPRLKGTLGIDLWSYASTQHMDVQMRTSSLDEVRTYLERRIPVIAFLDLGFDWLPVRHFVVVVGLDPINQVVVAYNGRERNSRIPYRQFLRAWQKTNNWTLVVRPKLES